MGIRQSGIQLKIVACLRESKKSRKAEGGDEPFPRGLGYLEGHSQCRGGEVTLR